jgi:hypothetical protein
MSIRLQSTDLRLINMRTRLPFRYGIATLTALPHLLAEGAFEVDGKVVTGASADHLPPKWFTKNPDEPYRDELAAMFHVIESAFALAEQIGEQASVFDFWQRLYTEQMRWAAAEGYPPLLWNFGVSLVERAAIDAHCRAGGHTFSQAVRQNTLGINLCELHGELGDATPADMLPPEPLETIGVRHTIGLGDPLTADDIAPADRLDDGLGQSLDQCIDAYGLSLFKIKLCGEPSEDLLRLTRIAALLNERCDDYAFTLDGNESFADVEAFRAFWQAVTGEASLAEFASRLIAIEQPLHRDTAMDAATADALLDWLDRPPLIIDESDGVLSSCELALDCGYHGTSHKNCKGVFKGLANAALIEHRRRVDTDRTYLITGEDLSNVAPIALMQDLAVLATLGITHAERNSQHYFRGLTYLPEDMADAVLAQHHDMYHRHERGFPTAMIENGKLNIESIINAPFGGRIEFDREQFPTIDDWSFESLGIENAGGHG